MLELGFFILFLLLVVPVLGRYMTAIFKDSPTLHIPLLSFLEKNIYRFCGIKNEEMGWKEYAKALLYFNGCGLVFLFFLQIFQKWLPCNPQGFSGVEPALAFNTAASFVTNTNWQAYGGETTLSYFTQMMGLTMQNFVSAATGNAVLLALIRGIKGKTAGAIGNFWIDLTRSVVYLLLPLCTVFALVLVSQGVIQNLHPYVEAITLEETLQVIPMGPAASQIAIKQIGTNGGGFFAANSSHPFENPTPLSNFLQSFAILCIPASAVYMYGCFIGSKKQGWILFSVMLILWGSGLAVALMSESLPNSSLGVNPVWEGKEARFGSVHSVLWAVNTTATSNGSVNNMLSSLSPLAGGVSLLNIMIGELIFGGIGVGLCSMLMLVLLTVFLAGLMVGRTPEYLGKKIGKVEMQWVMLAVLSPGALILLGTTVSLLLPSAMASLGNNGPHGFSEILYAFASAAGNNGSAFAGLNANTHFYNIVLGIVMLLSRLAIVIPSLAIAGSLARKSPIPFSVGNFSADTVLFGGLLLGVILIVAALTFFPALALGPIAEHILMLRGQTF